jgi:hypothetical protein
VITFEREDTMSNQNQSEISFKTAEEYVTMDYMKREKEVKESFIHRCHPALSRWVFRFNQSTSDEERNIIIAIIADMQVGKSECSVAVEHLTKIYARYLNKPTTVVHMVKQVPHEKDYLKAVDRHNDNWKKYCQKMGCIYPGISCESLSNLKIKKLVLNDDKNLKQIKKTMEVQTQDNKILICQAGPNQMKKLRLLLESVEGVDGYCQEKFILFDESHSTTQWRDGTNTGEDLESIVALENVKLAYCSATPSINLLDEKRPVSLICRIQPKAGYVGPTQLRYKKINKFKIDKKSDFSKSCPPLEEFLEEFLEQPAVKKASEFGLSRDTPNFGICQLSPYIRHHRELEALTHSIAPDKINTIIFDSEEKIAVRLTSKVQKYINDNWGGVVNVKRNTTKGVQIEQHKIDERGVIKFQGSAQKLPAISNVLQIFADIPASVVERIMLYSGDCVSESIVCASDDFTISCDMLLLNRGDQVPIDRMLQYLRICHYKLSNIDGVLVPDRRTSTLCCDEELYHDIIKGYLYEQKKVEKLIDDQERAFLDGNKEIGSYNRIGGYTVNKTRIPKRQLCNKEDVVKVVEKGADTLSEIDGLKSGLQIMTEVRKIKRRRQNEYNEVINETVVETVLIDSNISTEEYDRLVNQFKVWKLSETKIAMFMKGLDPNKIYSEKEIKAYLKEKDMEKCPFKIHLMKESNGGKNYGKILEKVDGGFRLQPQLREAYLLTFQH